MIRKNQRGIWETDVQTLDLKNPAVLRWYVERKIQAADWGALDRATVAELLPKLKLEPGLRSVLQSFFKSYEVSHKRSARSPSRRRAK